MLPPVASKPEIAVSEPGAPADLKPEGDADVPEIFSLDIPSQIPSAPGFYSHKVHWPNETLYLIAKWYTGTADNWKAIAKANPELDPKKITIGATIAVPEDLLITRNPMPFSFLHPLLRKKVKSRVHPDKISTPAEPPKLFGPIESDRTGPLAPAGIKTPSGKSTTVKMFGPVE